MALNDDITLQEAPESMSLVRFIIYSMIFIIIICTADGDIRISPTWLIQWFFMIHILMRIQKSLMIIIYNLKKNNK